jgi:hypothetical protein
LYIRKLMKKLLSYKHWQLFLLIVICGAWTSPSPLKEIINSVAVVTFTLWIYAVGVYGQERIAELGLKVMNVKLFKVNVIFVGGLFLLFLIYSATHGEGYQEPSDTFQLEDLLFIVPGLYLSFAIFQTLIFACKTIAKIELRREVSFGDYFTNLVLLFFFFIGVWILQPKINRLIATENEEVANQPYS